MKKYLSVIICAFTIFALCACAKTDDYIAISEDMTYITYQGSIYRQLYSHSIKVDDLDLVSSNPTIEGKTKYCQNKDKWINIYTIENDNEKIFLHTYTQDNVAWLYCREDKAEAVQNDITNATYDTYKFEGRDTNNKEYCIEISADLGHMFDELISEHENYICYDILVKDTSKPYIYLYAYSSGNFFCTYLGFVFTSTDGNMYIISSYTNRNDKTYIPYRTYQINSIYYNEIEQIISRE